MYVAKPKPTEVLNQERYVVVIYDKHNESAIAKERKPVLRDRYNALLMHFSTVFKAKLLIYENVEVWELEKLHEPTSAIYYFPKDSIHF